MENHSTEPIFYNYKGTNLLTYEESTNYTKVYIVAYIVNTEGKYPFLRFLLEKIKDLESNIDQLNFIEIHHLSSFDKNDLVDFAKFYLYDLLMTNYDENNELFEFKGFFNSTNNLYLFIDISKFHPKYQLNDIYLNNIIWLGLVDEIVNHKHLCNIPIHKEATNLFIQNDDFCFLLNDNNESYEIPLVSYVGKKNSLINFTYTFGQTTGEYDDVFGPFYYFTDYYNSIRNGYDPSDVKTSGIVRFAVFTGKTKYIENNSNDPTDESEIKQKLLSIQPNTEHLTIRITDYDGKWANNYDSVYLGHVELDDGTCFIHNNVLVLKNYNQQVPLSYHFIDKKTLEKDENEYLIL